MDAGEAKTSDRAVAKLRDQIARDLHDDIGSNLGGIVLLSERWSRQCGEAEAQEGFSAIKEATETSAESMQDIVWLIQRGNVELRDLVARMRQSAQMILGDEASRWRRSRPVSRPALVAVLPPTRLLRLQGDLNNIRRHAGATAVEVRITIDSPPPELRVRDDGVGFDPGGANPDTAWAT